jgi:hypothetical protein
MPSEFYTFQKYNDVELANGLMELLQTHHIPFEYEDSTQFFDPGFSRNDAIAEYRVKLKQHDFERANGLLVEFYKPAIDALPADYYLFDFTDAELMEIVTRPDEWGQVDQQLSKKLLKERGREIAPEEETRLKRERLNELVQPEPAPRYFVMAGYFFAFMGGFIGVFIGWHIYRLKRVLPDGQVVYAYDERSRKHAITMLFIASIIILLAIFTRFGIRGILFYDSPKYF